MQYFSASSLAASISIDFEAWKQLIDHMDSSKNEEVCGILIGQPIDAANIQIQKYRRLRNATADPVRTFTLDPQEWIQCCYQESGMIGLFHSHPHSVPLPSVEDLRQLPQFASLLSVYLIGSRTHRPAREQEHVLQTVPVIPAKAGIVLQSTMSATEMKSTNLSTKGINHTSSFNVTGYSAIPWINGASVCAYTIQQQSNYILQPAPLTVHF